MDNSSVPCTPKIESQIATSKSTLYAELNDLRVAIESMESQLEPILRPMVIAGEPPEQPKDAESKAPLARVLDDMTEQVHTMRDQIRSLTNRAEL